MDAAGIHAGPFVVVSPQSVDGDLLNLPSVGKRLYATAVRLYNFKEVEVQPFVWNRSAIALDCDVLLRLAELDVGQGYPLLVWMPLGMQRHFESLNISVRELGKILILSQTPRIAQFPPASVDWADSSDLLQQAHMP